jgi:hypothetical protein
MATQIQIRRDTAANWSVSNPILAQGEMGIDLTVNNIKIGNALSAWNDLPYPFITNTDFNNYQTSVAASTATLLPKSIYESASASFATNTNVYSNFFPLTGGIITGETRINNNLTIWGNLSASGTTTFANTIFTTTSALSVFHIGSGPALWVCNNGDGDIASFYDIDSGVEVLHVGGNSGTFPNVGVKTSEPNKTFTVVGEISATSDITNTGKIYTTNGKWCRKCK